MQVAWIQIAPVFSTIEILASKQRKDRFHKQKTRSPRFTAMSRASWLVSMHCKGVIIEISNDELQLSYYVLDSAEYNP